MTSQRRQQPWKARVSDPVQKVIAGLPPNERLETERVISEILCNPKHPRNVEVERAGKYSERWDRWQVVIPSVGILTFTPIEQAPPVLFYTVIFDDITIQP